jgi:hypothetical protein
MHEAQHISSRGSRLGLVRCRNRIRVRRGDSNTKRIGQVGK